MSLSWSWLIAEGLVCREVLHSASKPFRLPMLPTRVLMRVMIFMVWALVASELDWDHFCFTWVLGQLLMLAVLIIANLGWTQSDLEELNSTSCSQSSGAKALYANMSTSIENMFFDYPVCVQTSGRLWLTTGCI